MYRKLHNGQLSIKDFHVPFCGTLDSDKRWVLLAELIPWQELEDAYAPRFIENVGAPAKPGRLAFGSLYIKKRLGLTDEETPCWQRRQSLNGQTFRRPWRALCLANKSFSTAPDFLIGLEYLLVT